MKEHQIFFRTATFNYLLIFLVLVTLLLGIYSAVTAYQLKSFIIPKPLSINNILKKLVAHPEMKNYEGVTPLNIVQISSGNLASLQSQIKDLDVSFFGDFIVQYKERMVVYNYVNDTIKGSVPVQQLLPQDFFDKLNRHSEMKSLQGQQPTGGVQLDAQSLNSLKQQSPEIYKNAEAGDYVLKYQSKIIIYNYVKDRIINSQVV